MKFRLLLIYSACWILAGGFPLSSREEEKLSEVPAPEAATESPEILLRKAFHAQHTGRDEEAIGFFDLYFQKGKDSAHSRMEFSRVLARVGRHPEAIAQARRARAIKPNDPDCIVNLARALRGGGERQEALTILEQANRDFQDNGEIEFYLAEINHDLGRRGPARVHYTQVLFQRESIGWKASLYRNIALWRLAEINFSEGSPANARVFATRYLTYNPDRLYARFFLGYHLYYRENEYARARQELELILGAPEGEAERQGVDLREVYGALGAIYFLEDDHHAIEYLRESIHRSREKPAILEHGLLYAFKKEDRKALEFLIPFVQANQTHFIARVAVLRILARMDRPDLLGDELRKVSMLAGRVNQHRIGLDLTREAFDLADSRPDRAGLSRSELYQQMARHYHALEQPRRTVFYLRQALVAGDSEGRWKTPAERAIVVLGLARIISENKVGRAGEAEALCQDVLRVLPAMHEAYFTRGLIRLKERRVQEAIGDFSTAIAKLEAAAPSAQTRAELASYYYFRAMARQDESASEFDETVADLKKVLSINESFADANNFLGYLYAERGERLDEARGYIERAVNVEPTRGAFQDSLGWVYYKTGELHRARYHLQLATMLLEEAGEKNPVVYDHLGDVWLKLKYPQQAILAYNRALSILNEKIEAGRAAGRDLSRDQKLVLDIQKKVRDLSS